MTEEESAKKNRSVELIKVTREMLLHAFNQEFDAGSVAHLANQVIERRKKKPVIDFLDQQTDEELAHLMGEAVLINNEEKKAKYLKQVELFSLNKEVEEALKIVNTQLNDFCTKEELQQIVDAHIGNKHAIYTAPNGKNYVFSKKKLKKELGIKF